MHAYYRPVELYETINKTREFGEDLCGAPYTTLDYCTKAIHMEESQVRREFYGTHDREEKPYHSTKLERTVTLEERQKEGDIIYADLTGVLESQQSQPFNNNTRVGFQWRFEYKICIRTICCYSWICKISRNYNIRGFCFENATWWILICCTTVSAGSRHLKTEPHWHENNILVYIRRTTVSKSADVKCFGYGAT